LIVSWRNPPAIAELAQVSGVREVSHLDDGRWRILHEPGQDLAEQLVRISVERNWGLREIGPERASLEQIFVELTTREANTSPAEAAA